MSNHVLTDQMGREITVPINPQRIISLVPSQTELLFDLGLEDRVVGRTKFCIHPKEKCVNTPVVGGTKQFRMETIHQLKPDLIIGNKEENYQEGIEELANDYPVWMSDIVDLEDAYEMMMAIGALTQTTTQTAEMVTTIKGGFASLAALPKRSALYLIWKKPYMAAGKNTFIDVVMGAAGIENCLQDSRYPELDEAQLKNLNPDLVLLSSEPYPFKQQHIEALQAYFPTAHIRLVDGELFSWYGSRLQYTPNYLSELFAEYP